MFKYVFAAIACLAISFPAAAPAQDCGCEPAPAPCVKMRKRLKLVDVQHQVCRPKMVCGTDACGCSKRQVVHQHQMVTRKRLTVVEEAVDPCGCKAGPMKKLIKGLDRMKCRLGINPAKHCSDGGCGGAAPACGCAAPAPAPCGCSAPAPAQSCCDGGEFTPIEGVIVTGPSTAAPAVAAPVMADSVTTEAAPMFEAPAGSSILEGAK